MGQAVGGGCESAGGVHLALSSLILRKLPIAFRPLLRRSPARARLLRFRFGCAAQRSVTRRSWPGRPRRRRAAEAPRRMRNGHGTRRSAAACACTADGGGDSAAALGRFAASGNGAPVAVPGVHDGTGCDERSDDSAIAVVRRMVQRGPAIAAHGEAGVKGVVPQYPTGTRKQNSTQAPRVDRFA
jgi:hypothetical protein